MFWGITFMWGFIVYFWWRTNLCHFETDVPIFYTICLRQHCLDFLSWFLYSALDVRIHVPFSPRPLQAPDCIIPPKIINVVSNFLVGFCVAGANGKIYILTSLDYLYVAIHGIFVTPVAYGCLSIASMKTNPTEVSLIAVFEVVLGPFWTYLFLDELINVTLGSQKQIDPLAWKSLKF